MNCENLITVEPGKRGGRPCIPGLRITVGDVLGWLAAGMTHPEIIKDYPELTEEDIRACLAYAADKERNGRSAFSEGRGGSPEPVWAITPKKVEAVVNRLVEVGRPRKVFLFGSYVRGQLHRDSDVDMLVVAGDGVENPRKESVRLRRAVSDNGQEVRTVFEHTTEVRDIAFYSKGELFFSEATRDGLRGIIYTLGNPEAPRRRLSARPVLIVLPGQIGDFWAGHFAFDPLDKIFAGYGGFIPGELYEHVGSGFERRYSFEDGIAGFAFADVRRLFFVDDLRSLYVLEDFSRRSKYFTREGIDTMTDVSVVRPHSGSPDSIQGRLVGGDSLWSQTSIELRGPGVFWREAGSVRPTSDGSYRVLAPSQGQYWVGTDMRGDSARSFEPRWQSVRVAPGARPVRRDFPYR